MNSIFGDNSRRPYVIFAPRWIESSAGIRALHFLCHAINESGGVCYLALSEPAHKLQPRVSGNLNTPVLTQEIIASWAKSKISPIVIYSETVVGNPLGACTVIRLVMNFPGALGGPKLFETSEFLVAYSERIRESLKVDSPHRKIEKLFIPAIDPRPFNFEINSREDFYLLYAGKYRAFVGAPPTFPGLKIVEIRRDGRERQSRKQLIHLLSRCRAVLSLENSSIINEAVLSGAPGIFIPNQFLTIPIAEAELGWGGVAWGFSESKEELARSTLRSGRDAYMAAISQFKLDLASFVEYTQKLNPEYQVNENIVIPKFSYFASRHRIRLAFQIGKNLGVFALCKVVINFVMRSFTNPRPEN